jgi:hypothetical protein
MRYKYNRTYHLPWTQAFTSDDKILKSVKHFEGKRVIVTVKMDGENSSLYRDYFHARSLDSNNHPSRNWLKKFHSEFAFEIPEGWRICGENIYAKHSIAYDNLCSYFYGFSIWNEKNECLNWEETLEWFDLFKIIPVEVLYDGIWNEELIRNIDYGNQEGYVVRSFDSFHYDDFKKNVAKCVRANHVQTDNHWIHSEIVPNKLKGE